MLLNEQQLEAMSLDELVAYKGQVTSRKTELEALKAKGGKAWTPELQAELDSIAMHLVDVEETIEEKPEESAKPTESEYQVPKGTENMVHVQLVKGRRFNSRTGEEISKPFVQMYTFGEWQLFQKHGKSLGYEVIKVLHNPYEK